MRKSNLLSIFVVIAIGAFLGHFVTGGISASSEKALSYANEFGKIVATVETHHIAPPTTKDITYSAVRRMVDSLDPHSGFLTPDAYADMQSRQEGSFFGIGIVLSVRNERLVVTAPIEGTPAWRAGIKTGDIISKIEGESTVGLSINEAVSRLRGHRGTKVTITIEREYSDEVADYTLMREEIPTTSVYKFVIPPDIGYVRIRDFTRTTGDELSKALNELMKLGIKKLLVDLRGNPGGLLAQAAEVSELFLNKGDLIVYTRGRMPGSNEEFYARRETPLGRMPIIILVNNVSASAAEIVAGALQDHDRALIAGVRTWGKGLVQSVYRLNDGSALALTTAKYYTPSGRLIQRDYSDYEKYFLEGWDRESDPIGETNETPAGEEKETDAGRKVYGGGGIAPDVDIKTDEPKSELLDELYRKYAIARFAAMFGGNHPEIDIDEFSVSDEVVEEFKEFLKNEKIDAEDADWKNITEHIRGLLHYEIAIARFGLETGYQIAAKYDNQIQETLKHFDKAEELLTREKISSNKR